MTREGGLKRYLNQQYCEAVIAAASPEPARWPRLTRDDVGWLDLEDPLLFPKLLWERQRHVHAQPGGRDVDLPFWAREVVLLGYNAGGPADEDGLPWSEVSSDRVRGIRVNKLWRLEQPEFDDLNQRYLFDCAVFPEGYDMVKLRVQVAVGRFGQDVQLFKGIREQEHVRLVLGEYASAKAFCDAVKLWLLEREEELRKAGQVGIYVPGSTEGDKAAPPVAVSTEGELGKGEAVAQPAPSEGEREAAATISKQNVFRKDGDFWTLSYKGCEPYRMKDRKGFFYIWCLLQTPRKRIHVLELVGACEKLQPGAKGKLHSGMSEEELAAQGMSLSKLGNAEKLLDSKARAAYAERLRDLSQERNEAESLGDESRLAAIDRESASLRSELDRAEGLSGRSRRAVTPAERARVAVQRAISTAIGSLPSKANSLRQHLLNCIKTGSSCWYDPDQPVSWAT
jgi:hypothetical protein